MSIVHALIAPSRALFSLAIAIRQLQLQCCGKGYSTLKDEWLSEMIERLKLVCLHIASQIDGAKHFRDLLANLTSGLCGRSG